MNPGLHPNPNRNPGPHLAVLVGLVMIVLLLPCCGREHRDDERIARPEIPFRDDGGLVFLRNGEPLDSIRIEIADTDSARTRGMMQRYSLPPQSGMLFIFDDQAVRSFWMANTQMSLDIFFIDSGLEIVNIARYTRPLSPDQVLSQGPARYVLETAAGYADSRGIAETDRVEWWRGSAGPAEAER